MSGSSTRAVYSGSIAESDAATCNTQVVLQVPADLTYSMSRFLEDGSKTPADNHLRQPVGFGQAQSQADAKAQMQAQLLAIDEKFHQSSDPGIKSSPVN